MICAIITRLHQAVREGWRFYRSGADVATYLAQQQRKR